jgi:SAM-dependent methyltransferase
MPLHPAAAQGFEAAADVYARARPGYPAASIDAVVAGLGLARGDPLLDLGAGTGKLAAAVAGRGVRVLAAEPVSAMRARLAALPGVTPIGAAAEALPFRDGALGAIAAATAFHWFDGPRALRELHRVLRAGGRLALVWNVRDESVDWIARLTDLVNRVEGDSPRYRTGRWRDAFDAAPGLFTLEAEHHLRNVHVLPPEGVVDRVASISFVAALAPGARAALLDEVRGLLAAYPDTAGRTAIDLVYRTDVFVYARR